MRMTLPQLLAVLCCALAFAAGCNPPATPTCSPYIGHASINEVSKVQQNPSNNNSGDDANDFVEIKIMSAALSATTLANWKIQICESGTSTCPVVSLSTATITGSGASRYYVLKSLTNVARSINFAVGTEIALADESDRVVDYLTVGGYDDHRPSCSFSYDTDATTTSSTRRIRRIRDGDGNWNVVTGNSESATEGTSNDGSTAIAQHLSITHNGTASTCLPANITLAPHSSAHGTTSGISGAINITTTTGRGSWSRVAGAGTFVETGGANDGAASYTFASADSSVVLALRHDRPGSVNINVSGALSEDTTEDQSIIFSDVAFLIETSGGGAIPTQIAGKDSSSGWNSATVQLRAVATNPDTGACTALLPDGPQNVELAYECISPATCSGANQLFVAGSAVARNNAGSVTSYTARTLSFSNSVATIPLNYADAGQIRLHARKTLTDGSGVTLGGSSTFVVRPFAIRFNAISGNNSGTANSGDRFIAAGSAFSMSLDAIAYDGSDAMDADGFPVAGADLTNNAVTPNFIAPDVGVSIHAFTPAAGSAGNFSASTVSFNAGANGSATLNNVSYSEVGSIVLRAQTTNYLGATVRGDSPVIGRFYPQQFVLQSALVTPACSVTTPFTYMDQPALRVEYLLQAQNVSGAVTRNYDTTAGYDTADISYVAENADDGNDLGARLTVAAGRWDDGVYVLADGDTSLVVDNAVFARAPADADPAPDPDGPFASLQLGIDINDTFDARELAGLDMQATLAGACAPTCAQKMLGAQIGVRYGRLAMRDTTGSELAQAITLPVFAEYFDGSTFVRNYDDTSNGVLSCTMYGASAINGVVFSNHQGELTAADLDADNWRLPATDTALLNGALRNYPDGLHIVPVGKTGSVDITLQNVPAWLQYDWNALDADLAPADPSATLRFGQYRGHDRIIYWRELH